MTQLQPGDRKPSVWSGPGGIPTYTASAFGGCLRALTAARLGYEPLSPDDKLQAIYTAGHSAEEECLLHLTRQGWQFKSRAQAESALVLHLPGNRIVLVTGHIDELGIGPTGSSAGVLGIVEVKSQAQSSWEDYERHGPRGDLWDRYAWQISSYMLHYHLPAFVVRWRRPKLDEAGIPDILEPMYAVTFYPDPPHPIQDFIDRAEIIEDYAAKQDLPDCSTTQSFRCSYRYLHGDEPAPEEVVISGLSSLAQDYLEAQRAEAMAGARKQEVRSDMLKLLAQSGYTDAVHAREGSALVVVSTTSRSYLDEEALSQVIDLAPYRKKGKESLHVSVKDTNHKEAP